MCPVEYSSKKMLRDLTMLPIKSYIGYLVIRDIHIAALCIKPLYEYLELRGIQCKTLWGALSNHGAFSWMNIPRGTFPIAEAIGQRGLHFSCGQFLSNEDIDYI